MGKEILTLGDIEIEKIFFFLPPYIYYSYILRRYYIYFGEKNYKYFIGYLYNDHKVKPLHKILPKTSAYVKSYDGQTKWMYFWIEYVEKI